MTTLTLHHDDISHIFIEDTILVITWAVWVRMVPLLHAECLSDAFLQFCREPCSRQSTAY